MSLFLISVITGVFISFAIMLILNLRTGEELIFQRRLDGIRNRFDTPGLPQENIDETFSSEYKYRFLANYLKNFKFITAYVRNKLFLAGFDAHIDIFIIACAVCALVCFIVLSFISLKFAFWGLFGALIPFIYLNTLIKKRENLFAQQLPNTLDLIAGSLRAGHSIYSVLEIIVNEMPKPTNEIFKGTLDEMMLGIDMKDALGYLSRAMPNNMDLRFFITSVILQREVGGNLAKILDVLSETIRERFKLMGKLQAQTAQARLSGIILSIIPPIICGVLFLLSPDYMKPLVATGQGHIILLISCALLLLAVIVIRRVLTVEI